jgi:hypothetical protein
MRRMVIAALVAAGLAAWAGPAAAQRNGTYDVTGVNPDGSVYTGQLAMQQIGLASWRVVWQVGGNRFEGFGMSAGPTFAVGFTLGERPGVAIYQVLGEGELAGQWTLIGSSAIGTETLKPR